jgi:rare lipoprotein A
MRVQYARDPVTTTRGRPVTALVAVLAAAACTHEGTQAPEPRTATQEREPLAAASVSPPPDVQTGLATWYGSRLAGHKTASGERFDPRAMTAAHRTLPFGTWVEVRRTDTGAAVRVRITDRGPFGHEDRIIDLSRAAADKLGMMKMGVARVELHVITGP